MGAAPSRTTISRKSPPSIWCSASEEVQVESQDRQESLPVAAPEVRSQPVVTQSTPTVLTRWQRLWGQCHRKPLMLSLRLRGGTQEGSRGSSRAALAQRT